LVLEAFQLREQLIQAALEAKRKETAITPKPPAEPPGPAGALQEIASAAPSRVEAPPPSPRRPAPPAPTTLRMVSPGPAPVSSVPTAEAPRAADAAVAPVEAAAPLTLPAPPAALALGTSVGSTGTQVEELLVCTGQNEVLHEWHCLRAEARLKAVEGLRQKAGQVQERIPLGATERVEFQGGDGRLVVRFQGDVGLVVRSMTGLRPLASNISPFNLPFGDWVARHVNVRGLLACGLMRENLILVSGSYSADLASEALNLVWRSAVEAFELVRGPQFEPWQVRWIFEHGQLYWIRRLDGLALGILLTKEAEGLDAGGVQRVYLEFCSLLSP
jgi:hypothetical protein